MCLPRQVCVYSSTNITSGKNLERFRYARMVVAVQSVKDDLTEVFCVEGMWGAG